MSGVDFMEVFSQRPDSSYMVPPEPVTKSQYVDNVELEQEQEQEEEEEEEETDEQQTLASDHTDAWWRASPLLLLHTETVHKLDIAMYSTVCCREVPQTDWTP